MAPPMKHRGGELRRATGLIVVFGAALALAAASLPLRESTATAPQYNSQNGLTRPQNYREWIYLSSGLGMAYSPNPGAPPAFTNVFVTPAAYRTFVTTGQWPDKTMFVLEEREASSKGSINKGGHFQADLNGIAVAVKDTSRFPDKWAYFNFGLEQESSTANPKDACWQCHNQHGAVDNTFVQFYPTLKPIAMKFGTYKPKE